MRTFRFVIRSFVGAAALSLVACDRPAPPSIVVTPARHALESHFDLGLPPSTPAAVAAETAPPRAVEEQVEPSPSELVKLARAALDDSDLDRAFSLAKQAVLEAPARSAAWNTLGRVQLRRGEPDAALSSFEQAVDKNPSSAWARNNHGLALLYAERYDEAVEELQEATDLSPECGLMWNNLGMAYEHVDRVEEARSAYQHAMNLDHKGAAQNFVRLEGVRSLSHTAQADTNSEDLPMVDHGL
jgi:Flp pilus assembly protein TadD